MNLDITFCSKLDCENFNCKRHQGHVLGYDTKYIKKYISIANFENCEFWEEKNIKNE